MKRFFSPPQPTQPVAPYLSNSMPHNYFHCHCCILKMLPFARTDVSEVFTSAIERSWWIRVFKIVNIVTASLILEKACWAEFFHRHLHNLRMKVREQCQNTFITGPIDIHSVQSDHKWSALIQVWRLNVSWKSLKPYSEVISEAYGLITFVLWKGIRPRQ